MSTDTDTALALTVSMYESLGLIEPDDPTVAELMDQLGRVRRSLQAIASSGDYSDGGRQTVMDQIRALWAEKWLVPIVKQHIEGATTRIDEIERNAFPPRTFDVTTVLLHQEIRNRLAGKDAAMIAPIFYSAINDKDQLTIDALENAPPSFKLLSPEVREQGRALQLDQKPAGDAIRELKSSQEMWREIVGSAKTDLRGFGVTLGRPPQPAEDDLVVLH